MNQHETYGKSDVLANLSNNHSDENTAISNNGEISKELTDTKDKLKIVT